MFAPVCSCRASREEKPNVSWLGPSQRNERKGARQEEFPSRWPKRLKRHLHPLSSRVSIQTEVPNHALMPFSVSAGFATVHGNNALTINAVEAYSLDKFSPEVRFLFPLPISRKSIRKSETDVLLFVSYRASSPLLLTLTESSAQTLLNLRRLRLGSRLTFTRVSRPRFPSKRSYVREEAVGGSVAKNELKMIIQRRQRRTRRVAYRLCARYWVLKQKLICTSVLSDISTLIKNYCL